MSEDDSPRWSTPAKLIATAGVLVVIVAAFVGYAVLNQPPQIAVHVTAPAGEQVVCDAVVDGRPESFVDVTPVSFRFQGRHLAFAVIPLSASAGSLSVEMAIGAGTGGSVSAPGVTGEMNAGTVSTTTRISGMTPRHIATMRAAALTRPGVLDAEDAAAPE